MIDGDIFRIIGKCPDFETSPAEKVAGREHTLTVATTVGTLLALLQKNGEYSCMDIRQALVRDNNRVAL